MDFPEQVLDFEDYTAKDKMKLMSRIDSIETILFITKVLKYNRNYWRQNRIFLITDAAIYNLKKVDIQRRILLDDLEGVTRSTSSTCFEFVIHVQLDYDYRFIATEQNLDQIISHLKQSYLKLRNIQLRVYGVSYDSLEDFTTSKEDSAKGKSKKPPSRFLIKEEEDQPEEQNKSNIDKDTKIATDEEAKNDTVEEAKIDNNEETKNEEGFKETEFTESIPRLSRGTIFSKDKEKYVSLDDFNIKKVLGRGAFGKVHLVEKKSDGNIYAMKTLKKDALIENDQIQNTILEKQVLMENKHPFFVKMAYVFQDETKIYFVMTFIRGGELFSHLKKEKRFAEDKAKFYALQIVLWIGYLHKQGIMYRDVKTENILIGEDGYLFLTDFGLARTLAKGEMANTLWGTPEYMAPEIIK